LGEEQFTDAVVLTAPERLPSKRIGQYSVIGQAMKLVSVITRHKALKSKLEDKGIEFGGRVLLMGSIGTDFEAFIHYLAQEIPLKVARLRTREMLSKTESSRQMLRTAFEIAKRNSPSILWIDRLEFIAPMQSPQAALLAEEMQDVSWDAHEVIVVATTSNPNRIDPWLLTVFDRTFTSLGTTLDDRTRVFEEILSDRDDIDPALVAELTEGWSFSDVRHLAVSLFMVEESSEDQVTREQIEEIISRSGVLPIGQTSLLESLTHQIEGGESPEFGRVEEMYPDDFLDQLYLMAVGDNFHRTQEIIETLNQGAPLSSKDLDFLTRYPFLMGGTADDRLTRLLKAKKSSDRLRRIMGR